MLRNSNGDMNKNTVYLWILIEKIGLVHVRQSDFSK